MNRDEMLNTNSQRIEWGKNAGKLSRNSKGVTKINIDSVPALLMDIVLDQGERLQTYTFFHGFYPNYGFSISIVCLETEYMNYAKSIETFINTMKLDFGLSHG